LQLSALELIRLSEDTLRFSDSLNVHANVHAVEASKIQVNCDVFLTDPPYADAVMYHEITEFFIAWLRKNPPAPFNEWVWDSRRALAIKGSGNDFRRGMVDAYTAMTQHMPDNGMQCVMFTHQDIGVWSDMVGIFWAAGFAGRWSLVYRHRNHLGTEKRRLCARHGNSDAAQTLGWRQSGF